MNNSNSPAPVKTLAMSVDNLGFLLDRMGQDCHPLQFLRELTQNSIEAIIRTGEQGTVTWDVDWITYDLTNEESYKLCVVDDGDGMTSQEMIQFINQLSSSGREQAFDGNYGVGAKIAAATRNPFGIVYQSWRDSDGNMIYLGKDAEGQYGLRQFEYSDGEVFEHYLPLEDEIKPDEIGSHGTKVVLLGNSQAENTMSAPEGAAAPSRWISKYLNTRYLRFPENVTVKVREGWEHPRTDKDRNLLRTIIGQQAYLDAHCIKNGVHVLPSATKVHWWILKDEPAITNNSGYIESAGHVAAIYQNELYDKATSRAGTARLQQFGIIFGCRQVVLYIEPSSEEGMLTTNTARTNLLQSGKEIPWSDWAAGFRETMPEPLKAFVAEKGSVGQEQDNMKSIRERLKSILDMYKVSRYKPMPRGNYLSDPETQTLVSNSPNVAGRSKGMGESSARAGSTSPGNKDSDVGNIYNLFEKKKGRESSKVTSDPFPNTKWVSLKDGTREENDMEDKAAKFLSDQNLLLINADFRVFEDMIKRACVQYKDITGIRETVQGVVRGWFEQALVETVLGVQALRGSKEWTKVDIQSALSATSLTAAVLQRYHIDIAVRRELGAKLGSLSKQKN